jgi:hypothetical protein
MKTDDLISMLSMNLEPVNHRLVVRTVSVAILIGTVTALGAMVLVFGVRVDLSKGSGAAYLLLKLFFTMGTLVLTSIALTKLARPGGEQRTPIALVALPFLVIMLLATISLAAAPSSHWEKMITGEQWLECLLSIPIIAILPFAAIVWAVRRTAPTNLARTGALVGLVAGSISATAYSLHCVDDSLPFVALWYSGTIAICTLSGALLGPRLLRW